jgi:hypothetical protein
MAYQLIKVAACDGKGNHKYVSKVGTIYPFSPNTINKAYSTIQHMNDLFIIKKKCVCRYEVREVV